MCPVMPIDIPRKGAFGVIAAPTSNYSDMVDMGSEASFDTVLFTRDPVHVQQALERFSASRIRLEDTQALAVQV